MKNTEKKQTGQSSVIPTAENQKKIENHKKAATHLKAAAQSHLDAAKHHENQNLEKASKSTIEAKSHLSLGNEVQKNIIFEIP